MFQRSSIFLELRYPSAGASMRKIVENVVQDELDHKPKDN